MPPDASALIGAGDPPAVEHVHREGKSPVLVTCDHASRAVPRCLGKLGLGDPELALHIGWDIGAGAVTRDLSRLLDAPGILTGYSRLVIDCNRDLEDPTSIPAVSDGVAVPGNRDLSGAERRRRIETLFRPYHATIERAIDGFIARGVHPEIGRAHV